MRAAEGRGIRVRNRAFAATEPDPPRHRGREAGAVGFLLLALFFFASGPALALTQVTAAAMNGSHNKVPTHTTAASGSSTATVDEATGNVTFNGTFSGLSASASAAGIHGVGGPGVVARVLSTQTTLTAGTSGTFSGSGAVSGLQLSGMHRRQTYCESDVAMFPTTKSAGN
jgi:hypothetical protein